MDGAGERGGTGHRYKRGLWTAEEDKILMEHVELYGKGQWNRIAKKLGLKRCGKSCRLRWVNYLSPNVKRGSFSEAEEDLIIRLHKLLGNKWSLIAGRLPGRTDNQVKNYWNSHLSKRNGCSKRQRKEEPYKPKIGTKSAACSNDSEAWTTSSSALLTAPGSNILSTTENVEQDNKATKNNLTGDALCPQNADAFAADGHNFASSQAWRDQMDGEMSSYQSLVQFSDQFLQFDFGWGQHELTFL